MFSNNSGIAALLLSVLILGGGIFLSILWSAFVLSHDPSLITSIFLLLLPVLLMLRVCAIGALDMWHEFVELDHEAWIHASMHEP